MVAVLSAMLFCRPCAAGAAVQPEPQAAPAWSVCCIESNAHLQPLLIHVLHALYIAVMPLIAEELALKATESVSAPPAAQTAFLLAKLQVALMQQLLLAAMSLQLHVAVIQGAQLTQSDPGASRQQLPIWSLLIGAGGLPERAKQRCRLCRR